MDYHWNVKMMRTRVFYAANFVRSLYLKKYSGFSCFFKKTLEPEICIQRNPQGMIIDK
jgi:hypothetical protein